MTGRRRNIRNTQPFQQGVTLIELSVVLLILVALAGLTLPMFGNTGRYAQCVATDTTMANIRSAIMGGSSMPGYLSDIGTVPLDAGSTTISSLNALYNGVTSFNPVTQRGWRGPYISGGMTCTAINLAISGHTIGANSVSSIIDVENICNFSGTIKLYTVALDSFTVQATDTETTVLPGSPIVLMQDTTNSKYFLVSGGQNNRIELNAASMSGSRGDDRVLYLDTFDALGNPACQS